MLFSESHFRAKKELSGKWISSMIVKVAGGDVGNWEGVNSHFQKEKINEINPTFSM